MVAVPNAEDPFEEHEQRLLLHGFTWEKYEQLLALFPDTQGNLHITYLEGVVELMTTGPKHEVVKTRLARLIEAWSEDANVELEGFGGTTFRREVKARGLEPDECYTIGQRWSETDVEAGSVDRPDIAIEVVTSNSLLDKLSVYAGLEVPEVWVWRRGVFTPYVLVGVKYEKRERSAFCPTLDFAQIARLARLTSQTEAVRTLRAELRATK